MGKNGLKKLGNVGFTVKQLESESNCFLKDFGGKMEPDIVRKPIESLELDDLILHSEELGLVRVHSIESPTKELTMFTVQVVSLDGSDPNKEITMTFYPGSSVRVERSGSVTKKI